MVLLRVMCSNLSYSLLVPWQLADVNLAVYLWESELILRCDVDHIWPEHM